MINLLSLYRKLPWFKGKLSIGKKIFGAAINKNVNETFTAREGIRYHIPNTHENIGIELFINGVYEQDIVRFLQEHVKNGDTYFDVGANVGSLGLPVVKSKPDTRYYGFEASPVVFEYLNENFNNNYITHFKLYNNLVHRDNGQQMKFYQAELYGKSSMAPTYSNDFIYVSSISLDSFCAQHNIETIDWLKIDVQGFELLVFEGMEALMKSKAVKNILFEFEDWAEREAGVPIAGAQMKLIESGYELFDLQGKALQKFPNHNETMIWARPVH